MSRATEMIKGTLEGALVGGMLGIGLCAVKGVTYNLWDGVVHVGEFVANGFNGLDARPTDWFITPEHFFLIAGGGAAGGLLGSRKRKREDNENSISEEIDSKYDPAALGAVDGLLVATTGIAIKYTLPLIERLDESITLLSEMSKYNPSLGDLLYLSIPTAIVSGAIRDYNEKRKNAVKKREDINPQDRLEAD